MDNALFITALALLSQRSVSSSAKDRLLDMTGIDKALQVTSRFIPVMSVVCPGLRVCVSSCGNNLDQTSCLTMSIKTPNHTPTHTPTPPAFGKARLTLIGCTDPFL